MIIPYVIMSILAIVLGQASAHLIKKLPPVVSEEITYKEFFSSLFKDFKIDFIYSLILLVLFNSFIYFIGNSITTYLYAIISFALLIAFVIDFKYQLIPDEVHIVIVICGLLNFVINIGMWWQFVVGALIGGAIFYLLNLLAIWIFKKEGMGFGDVKLMAALGFMFGIKYILVIALVSFALGAVIGSIILIAKNKTSDGYIPFGPFIVIATVTLMFIHPDIIINIYITFCSWLGMKMSDILYFLMIKLNLIT